MAVPEELVEVMEVVEVLQEATSTTLARMLQARGGPAAAIAEVGWQAGGRQRAGVGHASTVRALAPSMPARLPMHAVLPAGDCG